MSNILHILQHALGRDEYGISRSNQSNGEDYRNHYCVGPGSDDFDACRQAVADGLMVEYPPRAISGGNHMFCVTDAGKAYVNGCSPKPPKSSRKKNKSEHVLRIPVDIMRRGPRWERVCFSRGSGQYPGGNPDFTGNQPPALIIPCEDGTTQQIVIPIPDELIQHDDYTRGIIW